MEKIVVFDVETPNFRNDRICSIGLTLIENGQITDSLYYLVNPQCHFDRFNVNLHGISPGMVADAPTFPEVWNDICEYFRTRLVVAHNARFDLGVLSKTLCAYNISESMVYYADTLYIARSIVKHTPNHKLPTLCQCYEIELDHHNAQSDSDACAKLLCCFLDSGIKLDRFIRSFSLGSAPSGSERQWAPPRPSANTQALLTLNGILTGISCDNFLADAEIAFLQEWLDQNTSLKGNYPYDKIYSTLSSVLADGIITSSEKDYLLGLFKQLSNPVSQESNSYDLSIFTGKCVCLSGEFNMGSKQKVAQMLSALGASISNSVTQKTDILLVGGLGSDAWALGTYGNKIKRALELQAKGLRIMIIKESELNPNSEVQDGTDLI